MLVVKRKREEDLVIDGRIVVKVLQIGKESVRLGVMAPPEVPIHRGEVWGAMIDALPAQTPIAVTELGPVTTAISAGVGAPASEPAIATGG